MANSTLFLSAKRGEEHAGSFMIAILLLTSAAVQLE